MKRKSRKPTLLTSTFYPRDLLRPTFDSGWEFVPPRIPDGISLRNFGIQVPIYATLCDIVVYSPHGRSSANAQRLAERFREAIVRKRVQRLRGHGAMPSHDAGTCTSTSCGVQYSSASHFDFQSPRPFISRWLKLSGIALTTPAVPTS